MEDKLVIETLKKVIKDIQSIIGEGKENYCIQSLKHHFSELLLWKDKEF